MDPGLGRLAEVAAWWTACHGEQGARGPGDDEVPPRRARLVRIGGDPGPDAAVEALADVAGVVVRDADPSTADEADTDAAARTEAALRRGRALADEEVDAGADLLVVAERSPAGSTVGLTAAAAVAAMTGREPTAVVGVPPGPGGRLDDGAWMARVPAVRDLLRRRTRELIDDALSRSGSPAG